MPAFKLRSYVKRRVMPMRRRAYNLRPRYSPTRYSTTRYPRYKTRAVASRSYLPLYRKK